MGGRVGVDALAFELIGVAFPLGYLLVVLDRVEIGVYVLGFENTDREVVVDVHLELGDAAAKGAVVNLTRDLATELGPADVRVNCIDPGYIETPLQDYLTDEDVERSADHTLILRFGLPRDVGDAAVFLASEEAGFITGVNLPVDGGWLAHSGL